nr:hypoxanthine phosphoribosyltransferase [bacterium]
MQDLHGKVLISRQRIAERVAQLGQQITKDYAGRELLVVGILKGASIFMCDLIRAIDLPLQIDFMAVSSYGASTVSSGAVRILKDLDQSCKGKDVLIVEDIVDTGLTLQYLTEALMARGVRSLEVCCLLDKPSRRKSTVAPLYIGFTIPDAFIVGYGLDYAEKYRNLPDICQLPTEG